MPVSRSRIRAALLLVALAAAILTPSQSLAAKKDKKTAKPVPTPVQMTPDQAPCPALVSSYRGDPRRILAHAAWGDFTEEDLFLYLLVSKADVPLLYPKYVSAAPGPERDALRKRVQKALSNMALDAALAKEATAGIADPLDETRLRLAELPVHELVWIDRVLIPQNEVRSEDMQKYARDNPASTTVPSKASVRYILLNVPPDASVTIERETAARMDAIRDDIVNGKISFEEAARRFSQAPNAADGGLAADFEPGSFFTAFEDKAFTMEPGEVSPVVFGPNGHYLLKAVGVKPEETISSGKADEYVRRKLHFRQLQHRYTYAVGRLRAETLTENRAADIDSVDQTARVLRAGKFELSADQLWELFPAFVGPDLIINKGYISAQADRLISLELIAQANEKKGLANDPALVRARTLASNLVRAGRRLRELVEGRLAISTEEQVSAAMTAHPEVFLGMSAPRFSLIQMRILDSGQLSPSRIAREKNEMIEILRAACGKCGSKTLAELSAAWKGGSVRPYELVPRMIEDEVTRSVDTDIEVTRWDPSQSEADLPALTRERIQDIRTRLPEIIKEHKRFMPIMEGTDTIVLFHVEQPDLSIPAIRNLQRQVFRQLASQAIGGDAVERLRAERQGNGKFELTIP